MSKSSIEESLDQGYQVAGYVKQHNGQYGCAIATRDEPLDDEFLEEIRLRSNANVAAHPNLPYRREFGLPA